MKARLKLALTRHFVGRECEHADSGRRQVRAYACSTKLCVLHLCPVWLLRISHCWRFGDGVTGRGRTARNRMQGNTWLDRCRKPEGPRTEAWGSPGGLRSEVDYCFIYRDCEVVMTVRNIVFLGIIAISFFLQWAAFTSSGSHRNAFNAQT